ncbi:MAG: sulfur oxidation c-type cytochrome SoxX [Betaproteobacteria bacterium RIFCSPLOWO2_12_FULL_65_14]|nr:MAG: sulfur oxidation c-type cytochrome SoxX [Betaproteobacteria bacterium RIFCSPLOWO2_12_FULL_65_14]
MRRLMLASVAASLAACTTPGEVGDRPKVSARDLDKVTAVMKRDFRDRGQAKVSRVELDDVQRLCNLHGDNPPAEAAKKIEEAQFRTIKFPGGSLMGDWKRAEKVAQNGRGSMWSDKPGEPAGGSCYNCHQLSPQETSFGTLGPSLLGFGKKRGNGPDMQRYVYGKIYNSKAYNACSQMPRLGHAGTLTEDQIKDLVALLLDPASPVNK